MKKKNNYLFKNTLLFAIGNFATKFISFFLVPLYTNILAPSEYGTIDLVFAVCTILVPFFTLNISESLLRFSLDKNKVQSDITNIGTIIFLFSLISGLLLIPIMNLFDIFKSYSIYIYLYFISLVGSQIYLANLKGIEKLSKYTIGNILHTFFIAFFNIVFLVYFKLGIKGYFLAYIISNFITTFYALINGNTVKYFLNFKFNKKLAYEMIKYSVVLIPTSFMWWIMNSSDRIMINNMISSTANGIYAISCKIPSLVSTVVTTFTQAWLFSAISEKDSKDNEKYTNNVFNYLYFISFFCTIFVIYCIKFFMKIYVSPDYFSAWKYVPFLIIGVLFQNLASFVSTSYSVYKDNKGFLFSGTFGAVLNIILNFILIPAIGIYGAALATCLSYMAVFIYRIFDTKKYIVIDVYSKKYIYSYFILLCIAFFVYIEGLLGFILLLCTFLISIYIFKNDFIYFINFLLSRKK